MNKLRFISFGSGSSGNSYYLGTLSQGILIDAGLGIRTLKKRVAEAGLSFDSICGVLITHDHIDHVKSVRSLAEKCHLPVYSTAGVHRGITTSRMLGSGSITIPMYLEKGEPICIGGFEITAFSVSHDGTDNVGYTITYEGKRFTLATDLGCVNDELAMLAGQSNFLVIEANYDEQMLASGRYPIYLKNRISSPTGHLSNDEAGRFIADIYTPQLSHVFLCHLSHENNHPEKAYQTVSQHLTTKGAQVNSNLQLHTLPRTTPSCLFTLTA